MTQPYNQNGTYIGRGTRTRLRQNVGHSGKDGFSLREHLKRQGVVDEEQLRFHMGRINEIREKAPGVDIKRYRVNGGK